MSSASPFGRRYRPWLALALLSVSACQHVFGDFREEGLGELEPSSAGRGGESGEPCTEPSAQCAGAELNVCSDGFWAFQADCGSPELCDDSGEGLCLQCFEGAFQCLNDQDSQRCEDNQWVEQAPCGEKLSCDPELERCTACRVGDGVCMTDEVLCICLEDQSGWEARTCPGGCEMAGTRDHCAEDVSVAGGPNDFCTNI